VTVPADRLVFGEDFGKLLGSEIPPFGSFEIRALQGGRVVEMMKRANWLVAESATLLFVPVRNDIPDEAVGGTDLDLAETLLPAVLALGPAGTFFQAKCGLGEERADGGLSSGYVDSFGLACLGASDQAFAFVGEIGADSGDGSENEEANCECEDG
jgi:hypothetical protein